MNQSIVVIESEKNGNKLDLMKRALHECKLKGILESALQKSGKEKNEFLVLIKPNLAMFFKDTVTITDPELVECLVDLLFDYGFTKVALGEATNIFSKWLKHREIHHIAGKAGYKVIPVDDSASIFKCVTPEDREYDFIDLHADAIDCELPKYYSLYGLKISKNWQQADFRISFPKNKTHEEYVYTLCLKNLLGALSDHRKHLFYHSRLKVQDVCFELHKQFPIHFNIIDAISSSHHNTGAQVAQNIFTNTIIAGDNTILVDWVGALKMGIDPHLSPLNRKALKYEGLPEDDRIVGSLKPYENCEQVHPLTFDVLLRLDKNAKVRDILWPATFENNDKLFQWKNTIPRLVNKFFSPFWKGMDKFFIIHWILVSFLYFLVFLTFILNVFKKIIFKKALKREELPINCFDPNYFRKNNFDKLPEHIKLFEEIIDSLPKKKGTCHTFIEGGILFFLERYVDIEYEDFVKKMNIKEAVSTMKDFIGGRSIPVDLPSDVKTEYRIERTVYLPQPNLLAIMNAKDIDVTKIERIEYGENFHKIIWKTVFSDNDSALYDDGSVTFKKDCDRTQIKIIVHQAFKLPKIVTTVLKYTGLRKYIEPWLYKGYFKKTIANYHKKAEQKYERIGKNWISEEEFMARVSP